MIGFGWIAFFSLWIGILIGAKIAKLLHIEILTRLNMIADYEAGYNRLEKEKNMTEIERIQSRLHEIHEEQESLNLEEQALTYRLNILSYDDAIYGR